MTFLKKLIIQLFGSKTHCNAADFTKVNTILIRPLGEAVGDAIVHAAYAAQLKSVYPNAQISILVSERNKEIFSYTPAIDKIVTRKQWYFFFKMRHKIDLLLDFYESFTTSDILRDWLLQPKISVIFHKRSKKIYNLETLSNYDYYFPPKDSAHFAQRMEQSGLSQHIPLPPVQLSLNIPTSEIESISYFWKENNNRKIRILIAPQGSQPERLIPAIEIAQIINNIPEFILSKIHFILGNTYGMSIYLKELKFLCPKAILLLSPPTKLSQYIALTASCDLVICVDSGTVHLACSLQKPLLCFYANLAENIKLWRPLPHQDTPCLMIISNESQGCRSTKNFSSTPAIHWLNTQLDNIFNHIK